MTGFSADWLALREPFDREARANTAPGLGLHALGDRLRRGRARIEVLDLACGTGANLRALAPELRGDQRWVAVDHDAQLLAQLPVSMARWAMDCGFDFRGGGGAEPASIGGPGWHVEFETLQLDLVQSPDMLPLAGVDLVTAAALLDLVSANWLDDLLARVAASRPALLFALSVDGRLHWEPALEGDAEVARLFAAHQQRDKGFGPALGGAAPHWAAARLDTPGLELHAADSDWRIDGGDGPAAQAMLAAMVDGIASAAIEQDPAALSRVLEWKLQRLDALARSLLVVGHRDLLAIPLTS
ncbi:class I SAM-dependent methyltransferase [Variovorax sp. J22P168]|uniref:class I SAM-dependent methyltransferase n=1 Tax=Variovorax jilinensis TaxID=3053513 RepID=UPI002574C71A|nr:class I SAM-dependent methyltransferase [Variovorax sp. J22P168]MDM0012798.1 class I SAM-dependent methyltransferase [Variovorax sp. J22P168]